MALTRLEDDPNKPVFVSGGSMLDTLCLGGARGFGGCPPTSGTSSRPWSGVAGSSILKKTVDGLVMVRIQRNDWKGTLDVDRTVTERPPRGALISSVEQSPGPVL